MVWLRMEGDYVLCSRCWRTKAEPPSKPAVQTVPQPTTQLQLEGK